MGCTYPEKMPGSQQAGGALLAILTINHRPHTYPLQIFATAKINGVMLSDLETLIITSTAGLDLGGVTWQLLYRAGRPDSPNIIAAAPNSTYPADTPGGVGCPSGLLYCSYPKKSIRRRRARIGVQERLSIAPSCCG